MHNGKLVDTFDSEFEAMAHGETKGLIGYVIQPIPVIMFSLN